MNTEDAIEFKERIQQRISGKYPDFDKEWKELFNGMGHKVVAPIRQLLKKQLDVFGSVFSVSITVIVDNNFVFGNIKKITSKEQPLEDSFIYKLCTNEFIKFHAPPKLKEELYDKIETILTDNKEMARQNADTLLQYITIKDAEWVQEWQRANNLIGHIDQDDVPYLALALDIGGHSIISYDKVFLQQNDVQIWDQQDLGKIVTSYNSGSLSLLILGIAGILIYQIVRFIVIVIKLLFDAIVAMISGLLLTIAAIPWQLWVSAGAILALLYHHSDEVKEFVQDAKITGKEWFEERKRKWVEGIHSITHLLKTLYENEDLKMGFDFTGFLLTEFNYLNEELKRIELAKAK